jgi:hypothetical protein
MESVFKKIYVLLHTTADGSTTDMGEANDPEALQKLYDTLNDSLVLTIIDSLKRDAPIPFVPKTKLRMRYCSKNGVYLQNIATEPLTNLVNTHDDFFRYFEKYKRSLYGDRAINKEMADTLLKAIKDEPLIQEQIRMDERCWFNDQIALSRKNGTPMIVHTFPKFMSHERLDALKKAREIALEILSTDSNKN